MKESSKESRFDSIRTKFNFNDPLKGRRGTVRIGPGSEPTN